MAFRAVGHGHSGTPPSSTCPEEIPLVATDYFSKWVEAEAYASIKDKDVTKFVWKNIVCRFGIPQIIIADNGPQFDSIAFRNFCSELNIRNSYSTPRYPQSNGQAEATNKTLINALKKRLEQAKGKWVEELPGVLWAYRTTPGRPTGNTPFALTYGMDAVIPTEIGLPTIRRCSKKRRCQQELGRNLDWADEVRESAAIRMADYQQRHQRITIEKDPDHKKYRRKNYSRKIAKRDKLSGSGSHGASFLHGGIEGVSRLTVLLHAAAIPKDKRIIHLLLVIRCKFLPFHSKLPFKFLFLHIQTPAAASLPSVSFHSKLLSGVDSIHPLAGLPHPPPHEGGPQLILLDPSPQPTPPGGLHFPLAWWIDWPQPPPFSDAVIFNLLAPRGEGPHIVCSLQQLSKKIVLLRHAAEAPHQLNTNKKAK
ncbi:Gag-Pol polyprotein, partial [Vitis vinifera]